MNIIISLFLTFLSLVNFANAEPLTLQQCLLKGLAVNPQVAGYRLSVEAEQEGIYGAYGSFLPTLNVNYGISKLENNARLAADTDSLSQKNKTWTVRLSQPLYTGFAGISGLEKAHQLRSYREYELQYMEHQLAREIQINFYGILQAKQLISKWIESVERLERQQEIAKAWVAQELAPRQRELEVAVKLANAVRD